MPPAPVDAFAFYLPQFYPVDINSTWWGEGFTEWVSVVRAHAGLRSPKGTTVTPGELGFYDLRSRDIRERQGELAKESGLGALCLYHYWSAGTRLLPEVEDLILSDGQPDFPFFLGWANHSWTLQWQGKNDVIHEQRYDEHENDSHIEWILNAMADPRYYTLDNKHVLYVYDIASVPNVRQVMAHWRELAAQRGITLLILGGTRSLPIPEADEVGVDGWVQGTVHIFAAESPRERALASAKRPGSALRHLQHRDVFWSYADLSDRFATSLADFPANTVPMVLTGWNNIGRRVRRASSTDSTPEKFGRAVRRAIKNAPTFGTGESSRKLVAINAWNEWGEGMTMEPSIEWGRGYLAAAASELRPEGDSRPHGSVPPA